MRANSRCAQARATGPDAGVRSYVSKVGLRGHEPYKGGDRGQCATSGRFNIFARAGHRELVRMYGRRIMTRVALVDGFRCPLRGLVELEADEIGRSPPEGSAWRQLLEQRSRARRIPLGPRQSSKEACRKCFPGYQRYAFSADARAWTTVPSRA